MISICTASAGAGKTHKLTGEYIKLLFSQQSAHRHILAVTFTNKATDEMKQRILQELCNLSSVDGKSDYLQEVMRYTGKDEIWVRGEAKKILISILHDYSSFRVSTIDKFFQLVMRSFAKELGRMATYNVELDSGKVLEAAVDRMFSDLDDPHNKRLLDWLIEYSLEAIENGKSWSVKGEIIALAEQLFKEDFKLIKERCGGDAVADMESVAQLKNRLRGEVAAFEKGAYTIATKGFDYMAESGIGVEHFRNKSRNPFISYLNKVVKWGELRGYMEMYPDTFEKMYDNIDEWYSGKKCPLVLEVGYETLNGVIGSMIEHFRGHRVYSSNVAVLKSINVVGILNEIYGRIVEYCKEKNIILLSESTELLHKIIDGSDTPFVYEKIGARIDNYMLDEFQDTSVMQWRNFYPLLQNSLSMGYDNLIVGDVKQSIYRWRGSDWHILNSQIYGEFREDEVVGTTLNCNWRSGGSIVNFNNDFFEYCAAEAQKVYGLEGGEEITGIYSKFKQQVPPKMMENPGRVEVAFVEGEEEGFEAQVLELLPSKIEELLKAGYKERDIAVLVRTGKEGNSVAQSLLSCGYDIISSDSLYISSSEAVQKVVNILREIDNPKSEMLRILRKLTDIPTPGDIKRYSLYQLCETLIRESLTENQREDVAFLQAFLDVVLEYTASNGTNITQFLEWWDESGSTKAISAPDDMNAIRIMTIHKSKGLGFNVVVIPFFVEKLDHSPTRSPNIWQEFGEMAVPVRYSSQLESSTFNEAYYQEKLNKYIDSVNTAYVAFTRAKKELVIFAPPTKMNKSGYAKPSAISDLLFSYYLNKKGELGWSDKIVIGQRGVVGEQQQSDDKLELKRVFSSPLLPSRIKTAAQSGSLDGGETIREHGIAMHYVFSLVDYPESIADAVKKACAEGVATCGCEELKQMVEEKIASVGQYGWFSSKWEVKNECTILSEKGEEFRPDRVLTAGNKAIVIDYKFGGYSTSDEDTRQHSAYKRQVEKYKTLLAKMGYSNVEGYLWYISANEIVKV